MNYLSDFMQKCLSLGVSLLIGELVQKDLLEVAITK